MCNILLHLYNTNNIFLYFSSYMGALVNIIAFLFLCFEFCLCFQNVFSKYALKTWCSSRFSLNNGGKVASDNSALNEALNSGSSVWDQNVGETYEKKFNKIRDEQSKRAEEIYRKYPFENSSLPLLQDCNNYFSGKFGDYFWHQNADQVYVYIPIDEAAKKDDIRVDFNAKSVSVFLHDKELISFECLERIIPDGSFWVMEKDSLSNRYILLDLEKRYRMINWKGLFGEPETNMDEEETRRESLKQLFNANKGMSKLTGQRVESLEELEKLVGISNNDEPQEVSRELVDFETMSKEFEKNKFIDIEDSDDDNDDGTNKDNVIDV